MISSLKRKKHEPKRLVCPCLGIDGTDCGTVMDSRMGSDNGVCPVGYLRWTAGHGLMLGTDSDYHIRPDHCPGLDGLTQTAGVLGCVIHQANIGNGWAGLQLRSSLI